MRKKRVLLVGPRGCGKTALARLLEGTGGAPRRAPETVYGARTIDSPGAYIENAGMYRHLIALAQDAFEVLLLMEAGTRPGPYPPNFAQVFGKPVTGVITKIDLAPDQGDFCRERLRQAGVAGAVFLTDAVRGTGIPELRDYLFGPRRNQDMEMEEHEKFEELPVL